MASHTFHDCCHAVIREYQRFPNRFCMPEAAAYAKAGIFMPDAANAAEALDAVKVQARYIRTNLAYWRGEEARAIKRSLDQIAKVL